MIPVCVGVEAGDEPGDAAAVGERGVDDNGIAIAPGVAGVAAPRYQERFAATPDPELGRPRPL